MDYDNGAIREKLIWIRIREQASCGHRKSGDGSGAAVREAGPTTTKEQKAKLVN